MEQDFQAFLLQSGFVYMGPYAAGIVLTARNQIFDRSGISYGLAPGVAMPYTTTGNWTTEQGNFVQRSDAALRQDLANNSDPAKGAGQVGYQGGTVASALSALRADGEPIFILSSGQSNMPQDVAYSWTPPQNLYIWNFNANSQPSTAVGTAFNPVSNAQIGPSIAAASVIAKRFSRSKVYVLNVHRGGLGLVNWGPTPPDYNFRQAIAGNVVPAMAAAGVSKPTYFIFGGCESDANSLSQTLESDIDTYLMSWLTSQSWSSPFLPSYFVGMTPYAQGAPGNGDYIWKRYNGAIRGAVLKDASARAYVALDDLPISLFDPTGTIPYIHRTAEGYYQSGLKIGMAMLNGIYHTPFLDRDNMDGQYTPTITSVAGGAVSVGYATWSRSGNNIRVSIRASLTPAGAGNMTFNVSVPVWVKQYPLNPVGLINTANGEAGIVIALSNAQAVGVTIPVNSAGARACAIDFTYRGISSDILPNGSS